MEKKDSPSQSKIWTISAYKYITQFILWTHHFPNIQLKKSKQQKRITGQYCKNTNTKKVIKWNKIENSSNVHSPWLMRWLKRCNDASKWYA